MFFAALVKSGVQELRLSDAQRASFIMHLHTYTASVTTHRSLASQPATGAGCQRDVESPTIVVQVHPHQPTADEGVSRLVLKTRIDTKML